MQPQNKKILLYVSIIVYLVFGIIGLILLPETLTIQINFSGNASNVMNKNIFLPLLLVLEIGLTYYTFRKGNGHYQNRIITVFVVFVILNIFLFIFNL